MIILIITIFSYDLCNIKFNIVLTNINFRVILWLMFSFTDYNYVNIVHDYFIYTYKTIRSCWSVLLLEQKPICPTYVLKGSHIKCSHSLMFFCIVSFVLKIFILRFLYFIWELNIVMYWLSCHHRTFIKVSRGN